MSTPRKSSDAGFGVDDGGESPPRPDRWVARPAGDETPEDRLAALLRASERPDGLSDASRARVLSRLTRRAPAAATARASTSRRGAPAVGLRWAIAMAMLLTSGGVIGAVTAHRWWPAAPAVDRTPPERPGTSKPRARRARPAAAPAETPQPASPADDNAPAAAIEAAAPAPAEPQPTVTAPVAPPLAPPAAAIAEARPLRPRPKLSATSWPMPSVRVATSTPAPRQPATAPAPTPSLTLQPAPPAVALTPPTPATVPPPTAAPSAPPTVLAYETRLLGQAVARLRQRRDASGALVALDIYQSQFPNGNLQHEADVARVDALLMLGRDHDALALLQTLRLQPQGRDQELRVIRGELAAATDCSRAIADFDRLLAQSAPIGLTERALYGRAVCRTRLGDTRGATRDLADYLDRFPRGRFAAEARHSLGQK
ncbi:MAG TPA: hypothetical protein VNO55_17500 [Polyangia bacterium]|nr:hypothetical protein [Polyangia bacterium]